MVHVYHKLCLQYPLHVSDQRGWFMYTTSFVYNIRCTVVPRPLSNDPRFTQCINRYSRASKRFVEVYVLTRGGGLCIPQVLFTIFGVCSDQGWWFMNTTSFVYNIHCMFLTRGGGSCIPQVLFTIFGVCSDQGWWFMYIRSFVYNIHCMFLTRGGGSCIPHVLFTISTACF